MPQFQFQTINHRFGNKIPIVIDPFRADIKLRLFFQKVKFLFVANGEQQKKSFEGSSSTVRGRVLSLSLPLPGLPGPLAASSVPSPWAAEKCARFWGRVVRGAWSSLPCCRASLTAELWWEEDGTCVRQKTQKGDIYTKPSKTLWKPLRSYIPLKGYIPLKYSFSPSDAFSIRYLPEVLG